MIVAPFVNNLAMNKLKADANLDPSAGEPTEDDMWDKGMDGFESNKGGFGSRAPLNFEKSSSPINQRPPMMSQAYSESPYERNNPNKPTPIAKSPEEEQAIDWFNMSRWGDALQNTLNDAGLFLNHDQRMAKYKRVGESMGFDSDPTGGMDIDTLNRQGETTQTKKNTGYSGGASLLGKYLDEMMDPGKKVY